MVNAAMFGPLLLSAQSTPEKTEDLATDRPGFTTPPPVVGLGSTQLESGLSFETSRSSATPEHSFLLGSPLVRFGIGHRIELRLADDGFRWSTSGIGTDQEKVKGWSDVSIGAKVGLLDQIGHLPAISLLPSVSVPSGSRAFTSGAYDPSLGIAWAEPLGRFSLDGTVTLASISVASGSPPGFNDLKRSFKRSSATSLWSPAVLGIVGFVEIFVCDACGAGAPSWIFDGGVTRGIGRRAQIDLEMSRGLSATAPAWSVSAGYVFRYDLPRGRFRASAR